MSTCPVRDTLKWMLLSRSCLISATETSSSLDLANSHPEEPSHIKGIIDTNALHVGALPGSNHSSYATVCKIVSRVNHRCVPFMLSEGASLTHHSAVRRTRYIVSISPLSLSISAHSPLLLQAPKSRYHTSIPPSPSMPARTPSPDTTSRALATPARSRSPSLCEVPPGVHS